MGQGFDRFHGLAALPFGVDRTEKTPHIGLGGSEHGAIVGQGRCPVFQMRQGGNVQLRHSAKPRRPAVTVTHTSSAWLGDALRCHQPT